MLFFVLVRIRLYADYNHPRLGGLGGKPMDWLRTTTGRHCTTGGFGEQVIKKKSPKMITIKYLLLFSAIFGKKNKSHNLVDMVQVCFLPHSPVFTIFLLL